MLFNHNDLKDLKHQLEYIDTAIIPVIEVDYRSQLMNIVDSYEIIHYLTMAAENQFKGRVLLVPPVQVQHDMTLPLVIAEQLNTFGMKHIVIVSTSRKQVSEQFEQLNVSVFPLETMDASMRQEMLDDQVKDLMKKIISMWNK